MLIWQGLLEYEWSKESTNYVISGAHLMASWLYFILQIIEAEFTLAWNNKELCSLFPPLSFPAFLLSSRSFGMACTEHPNEADVIPRTRRDGVHCGIGDICKRSTCFEKPIHRDFSFSSKKFKFVAKMVRTSQTLSILSNILLRHIRNDLAG